jgi:hypothetical protein
MKCWRYEILAVWKVGNGGVKFWLYEILGQSRNLSLNLTYRQQIMSTSRTISDNCETVILKLKKIVTAKECIWVIPMQFVIQ